MTYREEEIKRKDGSKITIHKWENDQIDKENINGVFQIVHGAAEHAKRYACFAEKLNELGYVVIGDDHVGHGVSVNSNEELGFFGEENGWSKLVEDEISITEHIKKEYTDKPIIIFGHSMGSFILRDYLTRDPKGISKCIICGTGYTNTILSNFALRLVAHEKKQKGIMYRSEKIDKLTFGGFNKKFKPTRTTFDWLSRESGEVDKYIEDDLCGFIFTVKGYEDLFTGVKYINSNEAFKKTEKNIPILMISGDKDPVGASGKGVKKVYKKLKKSGVKDITLKLYEQGRHEILNEINRDDVYKDIIEWIK
ncbi:alpha/beta fold hydrolase [Oceanirhabdus sp. W0125-5]|uniref:alpha/beta fold hydrolase n=1 Tax=Oceanirhabdus sp. W0125-5 TaxID=2999116 RepID=UPI0022F2BCD9|nr:alpha/beta hydrolase [Oceanirhabdus sp. W0125-5]WBW97436.1 alpha/beta hydrolase [Oceanirhabdus sp. W0125-5]